MSLYSTIQLAKNALFAAQTGVQVAANNIANADTPGYVRERMVVAPAPTQKLGGSLVAGSGVQVQGIVRQVDQFLQERLRTAISDMASGEAQEQVYVELESAIGELSQDDLSTALSSFFNSINDVLNQPEDSAVRNMAVLQGEGLADLIRHLDARVQDLREMTNDRVVSAAGDINKLVTEIARLNVQIIETEQGGAIISDAVGLRDKRDKALEDLAGIVNIRVDEQATGAVNVFVGGDYLVFDGAVQTVKAVSEMDRGLSTAELRLSNTDSVLRASSGDLAGLLAARDDILAGFMDQLDAFTGTLIFEFNKLHSSGQGLTGYDEIVSEHRVDQTNVPLDEAGLAFTPVHGAFHVEVVNRNTGLRKTTEVAVQLTGMEGDTTYESLVASLDAIEGLSAEIQVNGQLRLQSTSDELEFTFSHDTSGTLAALGISTFFTGTVGSDIRVRDALLEDASKFAVSEGGLGADTLNGERMASMLTTPLETRDGSTLAQVYERWMGQTAQASSLAQAVAEGYRSFHATLEGEHLGLSGVSLDEEAVNMLTYQRSYQAAAKVISTISELLDVLVNL